MIFDEAPTKLIQQTTANFHTKSDTDCIERISSSIDTLHTSRERRLQAQKQTLKALSRKLRHLSQTYEDELDSHNAATHSAQILALDTEKFRIAKAASELEIEGERLDGELRGLKHTLEGLDKAGVEGDKARDVREERNVLKLKLYRGLGIDAEQDAATGEYSRLIIRNTTKGDSQVINVDPELGRSFYARDVWGGM